MSLSIRHRSAIPEERRYTVTEAACLADVCLETVYRALRRGELHGVKRCRTWTDRRPGRGQRWGRIWWEVSGADLVAWYEARRRAWLEAHGNGAGRGQWAGPRARDRATEARRHREWYGRRRARDRAVLELAREIIRQAEALVEVEPDRGAPISA